MTKFQANKKYFARFIGDHDLKVEVEVLKRTAKTIRVKVKGEQEPKSLRIFEYDGEECVRPLGKYSMAPICSASKEMEA